MSDRSVDPRTLAGDPIAFAAERKRVRQSHRTEEELVAALREDEKTLGRPHLPSEREAFAQGFFSVEYGQEIRMLAAQGLLDPEDDEDEEG